MKRIFITLTGLLTFVLVANAQKKSGAIQFETTLDPVSLAAASGFQMPEEMKARMPKSVKTNFELLFTPTSASYMPVEETEDSNNSGGGGGMGRMMMRFGGAGGAREYYYIFADQKLTEVFDLSDTSWAMPSKLTVAITTPPSFGGGNSAVKVQPGPPKIEIVKTDEKKTILGFNCSKAIVKATRQVKVLEMDKEVTEETNIWYTNDLGFNFSPNPNMWTEGTVLALDSKGTTTTAKSIEYRSVSAKDVTAPKKALPITQEVYKTKLDAMIKKMRGGGRPTGPAKSIVIN